MTRAGHRPGLPGGPRLNVKAQGLRGSRKCLYTVHVRIQVLGSFGGDAPGCRMTSFLIDDALAVDAGSITSVLPIDRQREVRHILLSHAHMDHIASLPFLIENSFADGIQSISIYSTRTVLANMREHLFNNDTWPDFSRIPNHLYPSLRFIEIEPEVPFAIEGLASGPAQVTAIAVSHSVPTVGFLIEQGSSRLLFTSDTGPTERIWQVANGQPVPDLLITECSFPSRLQRIADLSRHLTPATLRAELAKVDRGIPVALFHFKPPYIDELTEELATIPFEHAVELLEQGRTYDL